MKSRVKLLVVMTTFLFALSAAQLSNLYALTTALRHYDILFIIDNL